MRRRIFLAVVVILNAIAYTLPFVLSHFYSLDYINDSILFWALFSIGIGSISVLEILQYHFGRGPWLRIDKNMNTILDTLFDLTFKTVFQRNWENYRICIFEPDWRQNLRISYARRIPNLERTLQFKPGRGCVGKAFEKKSTYWADLKKTKHVDFGVDPEVVPRIWKGMKSIIAIPLVEPQDGITASHKIRGVMGIDTSYAMSTSGFQDNVIYNDLVQVSEIVSRLLYC